jgi:membrane protein DedA with SNARE-associated domain
VSAPVLATITSQVTSAIAHHGAYAVFMLMALDTVVPLGGELIMLYAGVLAAGAAGAHVSVFGVQASLGADSYALLVVAGTLGSLAGALAAYELGAWGGRALIDDRRRWPHVSPERFERAQAWFERHGRSALFVGRITPVVRSFISIPAGVLRTGLGVYTVSTLLGSLVWCSAFAGAGWALAASWQSVHNGFRYADYAAVIAAATLTAAAVISRRRVSRVRPGA